MNYPLRRAKLTERQALQAEVAEILAQIAAGWQELESGSPRRTRRESLEWRIREREKRLAEVETRLAMDSLDRRL